MFVLDTNVVSEMRKIASGKADANVSLWAARQTVNALFITVVSVQELDTGIMSIERKDERQGVIMRRWMEDIVMPGFSGRILDYDVKAARLCAGLHIPDKRPSADAMIAAITMANRMALVTRNIKDFTDIDLPVINPWQEAG